MFLTIDDGKLVAKIGARKAVIENLDQANELLVHHGGAMCSSKVDFPEDYTDDAQVIELCWALRAE